MSLTLDKAFMVTRNTLRTHVKYGFAATGVTREREGGSYLGEQWYRTVWDLLSDILSLRPKTKVIFWIYGETWGESFFGTYTVREFSENVIAFFHNKKVESVPGSNYPFRVLIQPEKVWKLVIPFDFIFSIPKFSNFLWTIASKKSLGRGKSLVALPPFSSTIMEEAARALEETISKNEGWSAEEVKIDLEVKSEEYPKGNNIKELSQNWFTYILKENDVNEKEGLLNNPRTPGNLDIYNLPSRRGNKLIVEKVLEAWLSLNIDKDLSIKNILGFKEIIWFSNYVPCTVAGTNADFLLLGRENDDIKLYVFELKKDEISDENELKEAFEELRRYCYLFSKLMEMNLRLGLNPEMYISLNNVQPVLIAKDIVLRRIGIRTLRNLFNKFSSIIKSIPLLIRYDIENSGKLSFTQLYSGTGSLGSPLF